MKTKAVVLSCLIGVIVLFMGYEHSLAGLKSEEPVLKIGIVSVRKIFRECKRNTEYREQTRAEQDKAIAELEKLSKEIEAERAGLKTLKTGSSDHIAQVKEILTRQASLQAQQEFYKQQMALKDQQWTEQLYQDILRITGEVAKRKDLDLVFGEDEVDLSDMTANELMLTIRTHKLLYSGGCVDITDEVMNQLDAGK